MSQVDMRFQLQFLTHSSTQNLNFGSVTNIFRFMHQKSPNWILVTTD